VIDLHQDREYTLPSGEVRAIEELSPDEAFDAFVAVCRLEGLRDLADEVDDLRDYAVHDHGHPTPTSVDFQCDVASVIDDRCPPGWLRYRPLLRALYIDVINLVVTRGLA
jgi:hypothetical protein